VVSRDAAELLGLGLPQQVARKQSPPARSAKVELLLRPGAALEAVGGLVGLPLRVLQAAPQAQRPSQPEVARSQDAKLAQAAPVLQPGAVLQKQAPWLPEAPQSVSAQPAAQPDAAEALPQLPSSA
jgi:hypothetical protein